MDNQQYNNDFWTLTDNLGIANTGDHVAKLALDVPTPFTIGVIGKWGAGKTSILRRAFVTLGGQLLSQELHFGDIKTEDSPQNWKDWSCQQRADNLNWSQELLTIAQHSFCVWYSPWQHQYADNPLIPLLLEIETQYQAQVEQSKHKQQQNQERKIAVLSRFQDLLETFVAFFEDSPIVGKTRKWVKKSWEQAQGTDLTKLNDGQRFHILFENAIESLLSSLPEPDSPLHQQARLIVFIDDLDRCEESVVINLLESIKLYLNSRRCVFIFGIDDNAVLKVLQHHWNDRSEDDNREYLEKLFQAHLPIPVPKLHNIESFIQQQLNAHNFPQASEIAKRITQLLEPNPRKIKNFLNSLCASWALFDGWQHDNDELFAQRFVLFHYLRLYHKPVWRLLERQPDTLCILTHILANTDTATVEDKPDTEQFILQALFSKAFMHVLAPYEGEAEKHRNLPLNEAVDLFTQRIDRKRSDEYFIQWYNEVVSPDLDLPPEFLHLPI
jgi:hypothetical protein